MKKNNFYSSLLVFTLLIAGILLAVQNLQQKFVLGNLTWGALIYFSILTLIIYRISYSALEKKNEIFLGRIYSVSDSVLCSPFSRSLFTWFLFRGAKSLS